MVMKPRVAMTGLLLLATSCGGPKDVEVRAVGPALAKPTQPQSGRLAEARAHFVLGNFALALEQYRVAGRENPHSGDALVGMATCYKALGRPELAQRQLEFALAISPNDPAILMALAEALDAQGLPAKAALVRAEMQIKPVAEIASVTNIKPSEGSAPAVVVETIQPAPAASAVQPLQTAKGAVAVPARSSAAVTPVPTSRSIAAPEETASKITPVATVARTLTVKLPPVGAKRTVTPVGAAVGQSVTVALAPVRKAAPAKAIARGATKPRLDRLTLGEVALTTAGSVRWQKIAPARQAPVAYAQLRPARTSTLRILNAARVQGLAGSARTMLLRRGWRAIDVSDARKVQANSLLYVPRNRAHVGKRLAAQFSFPVRVVPSSRDFVLVLGSNANLKRARA